MNAINALYEEPETMKAVSRFLGWVPSLNDVIRLTLCWRLRQRSRRALGRLNTDQLRDIGISHDAARKEANKAFWQN